MKYGEYGQKGKKFEGLKFHPSSFILLTLSFILHAFAPAAAAARAKEQPGLIKKMLAQGNTGQVPISIDSDQASFDKKAGVMVYSGNVVVRRGKMRIDSDYLRGYLDEHQKGIKRLIIEGHVRVVKEDKTITAEKVTYYRNTETEEYLELEGNPLIRMQKNSISADKMFYYHTTDRFEAKGQVRAEFHHSPSGSSLLPSGKTQSPPTPITITSGEADFDTPTSSARFLHNVNVKRNDANLSAEKMEVFLEDKLNEIIKIVATDHVKIVQKDKEITASRGTFYDKERKIILTGSPDRPVISRQGENILKGQEIIYYLDRETLEVNKAKTVLHPKNLEKGGSSLFSPTPDI